MKKISFDKLLFIFFCLLLAGSRPEALFSQTPYQRVSLKNYSLREGLPSTYILFIFRDSSGFIWIATDRGVSRFDGQNFTNFTSSDGLESNEVLRIAEDCYHRVFFYCDNYRVCYYDKGKIYRVAARDRIIWPPTASMFFNRYNQLCISYGIYARTYDFPELHIKPHSATGAGHIIYGEAGQQVRITAKDYALFRKALIKGNFPEQPNYLKPYRLEMQNNYLLLITKDWVTVYSLTRSGIQLFRRYDIAGDVNAVNLAGENSFSVSTFKKGTYLIDYVRDIRLNYLNGDITTHTLIDRENNIWFGTFDSGLYLCVDPNIRLLNASSGLANDHILRLCAFNGYLFAGHILNGISYIRRQPDQPFLTGTLRIEQGRFDFNRITAMQAMDNKYLVVGTDNGIWKLTANGPNPANWKRSLYSPGPIKDIARYADSISYLTQRDLRIISDFKKDTTVFDLNALRLTSLAWQGSHVLVGTLHGLFRLDPKMGTGNFKSTHILERQGIKTVRAVAVNGNLCVIGTEDHGVFFQSGNHVININKPLLPSADVRRVTWTDHNTLWVCTPAGAVVFQFTNDRKNLKTSLLNTSTGLPSDNIADVVKMGNNYYIATDQGIAILPDIWTSLNFKPGLINEASKTVNSSYRYGNRVHFRFYGLSYKSLGNIHYRFRLKDIDDNWQVSNSGELRFDRLEPGNYTLEVEAVDRFNRLSNPLLAHFTILPLWYQWLWLRITMLLLLIFLGFLLVRKYYRSIISIQRSDFERELALQKERERISSEVHDDLGSSIFGLKLRTELLSSKLAEGAASKEISAIHEAISEVSVQIRLIIWCLETDNNDVNSLIRFICKQAEALFANSGVCFRQKTSENTQEIPMSGEKRRQVYLLMKEALNNIVKHADAKNALLNIGVEKRTLRIEIEDDGVGFTQTEASADNWGIRNMKKRAASINAKFALRSKPGCGTSVTFEMNL
jgi:ligand-binding sensor domain-containing protein/two-component sensor histidine kinase